MKVNTILKGSILLLLAACSGKDEAIAQKFKVDESVSVAEWKGSAPTHFHKGSFKVTGDFVTNGTKKLTGGNFTIPIASIENFDLEGVPKQELLTHLKSPAFFNLAVYPTATFKITKIEDHKDAATGANAMVTGEFTMIGQTHPLRIPAKITITKDKIQVTATFKLNRLTWGMNSFNDPKETLYILPDIDITLNIQAKPSN